MSHPNVLIIGTGLAGYNLAKALRKCSPEAFIVMITADDGAFYSKPQLSTALVRQKTADDLIVASSQQMAEQLKAEIITHTKVSAIDTKAKQVHCHTGACYGYDKLVIASGADVFHAPLAGNAVSSVISINDRQDYAGFRQHLQGKKHVTILGSGLVGCEYANDLVLSGFDVTVVSPDRWPLERFLPQALGEVMQQALADKGVRWCLGQTATEINTAGDQFALLLCNQQQVIHADLVLSAVGFRASEQVARLAGARCDRGVLVDEHLQTSVDDVYALGDCAVVAGSWRPYVAPILHAAKVLARVLIGCEAQVDYDHMPVVTKTSLCPCVVMPATTEQAGTWHIDGDQTDWTARYHVDGQLRGFALLGAAIRQRQQLLQEII